LPHLGPTGSSCGWLRSTTARYFSACPSDLASRRAPCPPQNPERRLQVPLGCFRLSPSCPFRSLHTFLSLGPTRRYTRLWIWRPSSERQRDFNPPEPCAAQRTLRGRSDFPSTPLASFGLRERFRLFALFALAGHGVGTREPGFWSTAPQPFSRRSRWDLPGSGGSLPTCPVV
jgi:hypothetical protein